MRKSSRQDHQAARDAEPTHALATDRAVGTVVAVLDDEVVVNIDGVLRRASSGRVSRLLVGDWVMIGVGSVLGVVDGAGRSRS